MFLLENGLGKKWSKKWASLDKKWASLVVKSLKNTSVIQETACNMVCHSESTCHSGDLRWIPGSERSPGERNGNPLQYSGLGNSMDRGGTW